VVRQGQLIAWVVAFVIGCAVLLVIGCTGARSGAPQKEQARSPEATASEEARCDGTRTFKKALWREAFKKNYLITTNDLPGCPKGGPLEGTDEPDDLDGREGDDVVRGLGGRDILAGGNGNDVIYGGPGDDNLFDGFETEGDDVFYGGAGNDGLAAGPGEDVLYGGDGDDHFSADRDGQRDKLYCGKGKDQYQADKIDYVDSSCEKKVPAGGGA
jgi:hypothetical protein